MIILRREQTHLNHIVHAGFEFQADGKAAIKAYYLPPPNTQKDDPATTSPIYRGDPESLAALRPLIENLPTAVKEGETSAPVKQFDMVVDYHGRVDTTSRFPPGMVALDVLPSVDNRMKVRIDPTPYNLFSPFPPFRYTLACPVPPGRISNVYSLWPPMLLAPKTS